MTQNITQVLSRPYEYPMVAWGGTTTPGMTLVSFDPVRFLLSKINIRDKLAGYQNFRASVRIRFQVTGNAFFAGKLEAYWVPLNRVGDYAGERMSMTSVSGIRERVEIYPIDSTTYELKITPLLPKRYWSRDHVQFTWASVWPPAIEHQVDDQAVTSSIASLFVSAGLVNISCIAPFSSLDPADATTIKIFVNFEDVEIDDAFQPVGSTVWPDPGSFTFQNHNIQEAYTPIYYIAGFRSRMLTAAAPVPNNDDTPSQEADKKETKGRWSLVTKRMSDMLSVFTPLAGVYAPLVAAASVTASGISSALAYFNFDKPRETELPMPMLPHFKNYSYGAGIEQASMLSLHPDNAVCPIGVNQPFDPAALDIQNLCAQPQLIHAFQLDPTMDVGTRILNWAVAPWNAPVQAWDFLYGESTASQFLVSHTYWSWLARCFEYWRSDCEVTVEVVAPAFAKAYLQVSWIPGDAEQPGVAASSTDGAAVQPSLTVTESKTEIIRVSGCSKHTFKIPYRANDYVLNCDYRKVPLSRTTPSSMNQPSTNGALWITVNQPLTQYTPAGLTTSPITILTSVSFPGMQFFRPSVHQMDSFPGGKYAAGGPPPSFIAEPPGSDAVVNSDDSSTLGLSETGFFGECIKSIMTLARRPGVINGTTRPPDATAAAGVYSAFYAPVCFHPMFSMDVMPYDPITNLGPRDITSSYLSWMSRMFLTMRGEVSYSVVPYINQDTVPGGLAFWLSLMNNVDMKMLSYAPPEGVLPVTAVNGLSCQPYCKNIYYPGMGVSLGSGASYRPYAVDGVPQSAIAPYYSRETFHLTPDFWGTQVDGTPSGPFTLYANDSCPGIMSGVVGSGNNGFAIIANATDNFSFGGLYPPCMTTSTMSRDAWGYPFAILQDSSLWGSFP